MMTAIKTITLDNVILQENGILRDENGLLIARLVDSVKFNDIENRLKKENEIVYKLGDILEVRSIDGEIHYEKVTELLPEILTEDMCENEISVAERRAAKKCNLVWVGNRSNIEYEGKKWNKRRVK